ncbi:uracil-DNA glycosylase [Nocardioides limicola]|uniref:uracil-DNA glycosylase n=1 Tax=Nocardioides limicola TaxID=2803368 RepID=UPI00193C5B56|nr:uracil-DNA glycosylase [Nocardioides sp. DJM-14]
MTLPHPVTGTAYPSPVPPGTGWPDDPADAETPVARSAAGVRRLAGAGALPVLDARVSVCRACPRLVDWRETVAAEKRASFADQPYWGRPAPGWGDEAPRVLVVGLAPAAHGANRTGRVFTGDRSGDWLYAAMHRAGLADLPTSEHAGDGQRLRGARIVAAVRCAPPQNKPTVTERDTCAPWLETELRLLEPHVRAVVALGAFGWDAALRGYAAAGYAPVGPRPKFGHGAEAELVGTGLVGGAGPGGGERSVRLLGCYHPSQQNTFTGRLTEPMLDAVFTRAVEASSLP